MSWGPSRYPPPVPEVHGPANICDRCLVCCSDPHVHDVTQFGDPPHLSRYVCRCGASGVYDSRRACVRCGEVVL